MTNEKFLTHKIEKKIINTLKKEMIPVKLSGVHNNEYVTGITSAKTNNNIGTTFQIKFTDIDIFYPIKTDLSELWIRDNVNGFLKTLNYEERLEWLRLNQVGIEDDYLSDHNAQVRFISLGGVFGNLSDKIKINEWMNLEDVYNMFPRKPGSKAKKHTLIFRPGIWSVIDNEITQKCDEYYDLISCDFVNKQTRSRMCVIKVKDKIIGVCDDEPMYEYPINNKEIEEAISWFTPGIHKSLIQKCIRYLPYDVNISGKIYDVENVIKSSFLLLLKNPGTFVPDLQKFVRGSESAMKRLAISIIEDSYLNVYHIESLLFAALLGRESWIFSETYVNMCLSFIEKSLNLNYFKYNTSDINNNQDDIIIDLIETLRSFEGDINMIKSCVKNNWSKIKGQDNGVDVMDISHCLDQHCVTDVIYFMEEKFDPKDAVKLIWRQSSCINGRKDNIKKNIEVELAQQRYYYLKTNSFTTNLKTNKKLTYPKLIDVSYISGMMGAVENKNLLSFFHPDDVSNIVTMRKPSRIKETDDLSSEELIIQSEFVKNKLLLPFNLKNKEINIDNQFVYKNDEFLIQDLNISWNEYCDSDFDIYSIGIAKHLEFDDVIDEICIKKEGIYENWKELLLNYMITIPIEVKYRLSMYIRKISNEIQIYKISRDGTGTYQTVNWTDAYVFRLFCYMCYILPGCIRINAEFISIRFSIINMFMWNNVRKFILSTMETAIFTKWDIVNINREMKPHQQYAVDRIMSRIKFQKKGNIIWSPVGSGKTFIVIMVLYMLMLRNELPDYVVYALPPSAYESVLNEFSMCNFETTFLDCTKSGKNRGLNVLHKHKINFIKHDHLREDKEQFIAKSLDIFLIVDEFHLTMNIGTQRTSICLELSKICNNFIAMTGTLIKDKNHEGIIEWISQVVEFELTEKNYMVGVASLISNKYNYGIEENRIFYDANIKDDMINFKESVKKCYEATKKSIYNLTIEKLKTEKCIFVVALNKDMAEWFKTEFEKNNKNVFIVGNNNSIVLTKDMNSNLNVIITTIRHSTGYTLTACRTMIQGVYFSNQATRTQLEGRIIRMGQSSPSVDIITVHCGILSYTLKYYEQARSIEKALSDLANEI